AAPPASPREAPAPSPRRGRRRTTRPGTARRRRRAARRRSPAPYPRADGGTCGCRRPVGATCKAGTVPLRLGRRTFADDELTVMAIVNRTPDSFYDRGATFGVAAALAAVARAVAEGAAIVDIGGVKAGPGDDVDPDEELRRTAELVRAVRTAHADLVISVDTWRSEVAEVLAGEGADLLNDTWGGVDPKLAT